MSDSEQPPAEIVEEEKIEEIQSKFRQCDDPGVSRWKLGKEIVTS